MQRHPLELAHAWLSQAFSDAEAARYTFEGAHFDITCFLAQQSVEKALKSLLIWCAGDRPRTHFIQQLLKEIAASGIEVSDDLHEVTILDLYYTTTRYPDALGGATPAHSFIYRQSHEALILMDRALIFVSDNLPKVDTLLGE